MGCGAETEANTLMTALLAGEDLTLPAIDLSDPAYDPPAMGAITVPDVLTNAMLTTKTIDGDGTFDVIMSSIHAHLKGEYDKNRITGEQYTKAYVELTSASLSNAVQFLLGKDTAYWQGIRAQMEAKIAETQLVQARVELLTAKVKLAATQYEALGLKANYALTKLKLSTESIGYCIADFNLTTLSPLQAELLEEQIEGARAQTMDTRRNGVTPIVGMIGKQKDLYSEQITSYKRDAENKGIKLFTDAWITQKTIDEGLLPPGQFSNANLDVMLNRYRTNLGINI